MTPGASDPASRLASDPRHLLIHPFWLPVANMLSGASGAHMPVIHTLDY